MLPCLDHGQGPGNPKLYGGTTRGGVSFGSHRVAYAEANGLDVAALIGVVMHTCDNPRCIEPTHLVLGTYASNSADMLAKGRHWVPDGAESPHAILTEAQVLDIRARYKPRCRINGCRALGREFNVGNHTVSDIVTNKTWRNV